MNDFRFLVLVAVLALATALTRFLPFLVFRNMQKTPPIIDYLGKVLPAAMMGLLVVYCFKDLNFESMDSLLPSLAGTAVVVVAHLWKRNTILSIVSGTVVYMIVLRLV